jgi:catechol 2,3-dioxygenase-like lactoylglutathione lyase family enzyme
MSERNISGIQQIGVGVSDLHEAWKWYRINFGMDIRIFEEEAVAELMLPHTEGKTRKRHAVLAFNMNGGGGFEVWQHTERTPMKHTFEIQLGDLGIFAAKMKTRDIENTYRSFKEKGIEILNEISIDPAGQSSFFAKDPYNNVFQFVEEKDYFRKDKSVNGGTYGAIIGVTDIEKSLVVYKDILGYDEVIYEGEGVYNDLNGIAGGGNKFQRIILKHSKPRRGSFSPMLGPTQIELIQVLDREPRDIFEGRIWGDLGFIHLCFDITGMNNLRSYCESKGFPFTVDSANSFDMGEAAGHFSYIADPDGTLIEFVETHKIPVIKKLGWYINLTNRNPLKSLPNFILKSLRFNRVKD